jgi:hypothetical protein
MTAAKPKKKRQSRPAQSTIKNHPERERIEADLVRGVPVRVVMRKYCIAKDPCYRFLATIPAEVRERRHADLLKPGADLDTLRQEESEGLLVGLRSQRMKLLMVQDAAMERADAEMVTRISSQVHRNLELVGKYLGEFISHSQVQVLNLTMTPDYLRLREALLSAMAKHPEARADVLRALREIEAAPTPANAPPMIEAQAVEREAA